MHVRNLLGDDDAVSPVIGVILMVAITVILAAVIASFVLGLGNQAGEVAPQASFSFDYDDAESNLTVVHESGDSVVTSELYLRGEDFNDTGSGSNSWDNYESGNDFSSGDDGWKASVSGTSEGESAVVAGDRLVVRAASDYEISVVWESTEGTDSTTLASDEGPEA